VSRLGAACAVAAVLFVPAPLAAQSTDAGRVEVSGGVVLVGGYDFGESVAELTPNSGSGSYDFFTTESRVKQGLGLLARIGVVVSPAVVVEGGLRFTKPVYAVSVSDDVEGAADTTVEEKLSQYVIEGTVVWHVGRAAASGGRFVPFFYGGAGYLRELHEDDTLVEDGIEYHAGGGVKWWFGQGRRRLGVRGEVGISIRDGGFDFEDGLRMVPVVGGSLVYRF
jgi:hypothetical protein